MKIESFRQVWTKRTEQDCDSLSSWRRAKKLIWAWRSLTSSILLGLSPLCIYELCTQTFDGSPKTKGQAHRNKIIQVSLHFNDSTLHLPRLMTAQFLYHIVYIYGDVVPIVCCLEARHRPTDHCTVLYPPWSLMTPARLRERQRREREEGTISGIVMEIPWPEPAGQTCQTEPCFGEIKYVLRSWLLLSGRMLWFWG